MKILDYNYRAEPSNQIAALTNDVLEAFWGALSLEDTARLEPFYYDLNRSISKALEASVQIVAAQMTVSREMEKQLNSDVFKLVQHNLSRLIADELMKSDRIPVSKWSDYGSGEHKYKVAIPVLALRVEGDKG